MAFTSGDGSRVVCIRIFARGRCVIVPCAGRTAGRRTAAGGRRGLPRAARVLQGRPARRRGTGCWRLGLIAFARIGEALACGILRLRSVALWLRRNCWSWRRGAGRLGLTWIRKALGGWRSRRTRRAVRGGDKISLCISHRQAGLSGCGRRRRGCGGLAEEACRPKGQASQNQQRPRWCVSRSHRRIRRQIWADANRASDRRSNPAHSGPRS